jgi:hypothetical protein
MSAVPDRARRLFRLLVGILLVYVLIVGFGGSRVFAASRVVLLSALLILAIRIRRREGRATVAALVFTAAAIGLAVLAALAGAQQLFDIVVSLEEATIVAAMMVTLGRTIWGWRSIDAATVLGVLCVYLLLALFFADLYQVGSAVNAESLNGVDGRPTSSDCLYLSVITLATVGYGDVTPATSYSRAVAITEAMVGQLYLVSIVAAVVSGWRRERGS